MPFRRARRTQVVSSLVPPPRSQDRQLVCHRRLRRPPQQGNAHRWSSGASTKAVRWSKTYARPMDRVGAHLRRRKGQNSTEDGFWGRNHFTLIAHRVKAVWVHVSLPSSSRGRYFERTGSGIHVAPYCCFSLAACY